MNRKRWILVFGIAAVVAALVTYPWFPRFELQAEPLGLPWKAGKWVQIKVTFRNVTKSTLDFELYSCSGNYSNFKVSGEGLENDGLFIGCNKNFPQEYHLAPGESGSFIVQRTVPRQPTPGPLSFRVGFSPGGYLFRPEANSPWVQAQVE